MIFKHDINNYLNHYYGEILLWSEPNGLDYTSEHVWGKEVHYLASQTAEDVGVIKAPLKTLKVECVVNSLDELNPLYGVRFSNKLVAAMENFFCEETDSESYETEKARNYILHQLADWDTLRDEDGNRLFHVLTNPDGTLEYHFFFVKYCAITPKKWDPEWVTKHGM